MINQPNAETYKAALLTNVAEAILQSGRVKGSNQIIIDNGIIIMTLVEYIAHYAAMHNFDRYTPQQLVDRIGRDLLEKIPKHQAQMAKDGLPHIIRDTEVH
jgi:hypothetical protein